MYYFDPYYLVLQLHGSFLSDHTITRIMGKFNISI